MIDRKANRLDVAGCDFDRQRHLFLVESNGPESFRNPIAKNVFALQSGQLRPAIDETTCDRCGVRMRKYNICREDGRWPDFAMNVNVSWPLFDGPSVVAARSNAIDHLVHFPSNIANP